MNSKVLTSDAAALRQSGLTNSNEKDPVASWWLVFWYLLIALLSWRVLDFTNSLMSWRWGVLFCILYILHFGFWQNEGGHPYTVSDGPTNNLINFTYLIPSLTNNLRVPDLHYVHLICQAQVSDEAPICTQEQFLLPCFYTITLHT